ncbi:MAG: hypothetical protein Q4G68_06025 [Planctomycetia bacterium]|nr:hypothetical protein [Planctomycetia bacterium]
MKRKNVVSLTRKEYLANVLLRDIRHRGLKHGDPYYSTAEAAKHLGIGGTYANQVLSLLEKQGVIERKQKKGAIIVAPPAEISPLLTRVSFVVNEYFTKFEKDSDYRQFYIGIQHEIPGTLTAILFVPGGQDEFFIRQIERERFNGMTGEAFVLVSVPYTVQKEFSQMEVPVVVLGSRYSGVTGIPQVDFDYREIMRLFLQYFEKTGRRRVLLLLRNTIFPGDMTTIDAFLTEKSSCSRVHRCLPMGKEAITAAFAEQLDAEEPVDAVICPTGITAGPVLAELERRRKIPGKDIAVAVMSPCDVPGTVCMDFTISATETSIIMAKMIKQQLSGEMPDDYIMGVRLRVNPLRNGRKFAL